MAETSSVPVNPLGPLFSTEQAATYLDVSVKHLRRLIETRRIRVLRDGYRFGIYQAWADAFIQQHAIPTAAEQPEIAPASPPVPSMKEALKGISRQFDRARRPRPRRTLKVSA